RVYRLQAERLRSPSAPGSEPALASDGSGLPVLLQTMAGDPEQHAAFERLNEALGSILPAVRRVGVKPHDNQLRVAFNVAYGHQTITVDASRASDGLLLALAFLVLSHGPGAPLLCLEEPENGVHPRRLGEIVGLLRKAAGPQRRLLMTTHSPYLLDALEPGEVQVVTRGEDGATRVAPMADFPDLGTWQKGFSLGEIWSNVGEEKLSQPGA
ncbi:MAG: AAA family ATPase, partial [Candidatus Eremiobacterota bacterium]